MTSRLPYAVECKSIFTFFERIAAFDSPSAALGYAEQCAAGNPHNSYRVTKRGRKLLAKLGRPEAIIGLAR
jgi:hypothetical protein